MDRRELLKAAGIGALGLGVGGCASRVASVGPTRAVGRLVPVRASWDRVIRTTVGLRPYRPSGFVVRAERLGEKTVIHNYGHGGAGHSLSWGTGLLTAELALEHQDRTVAVIGCGIVGLAAARQLQRHGFDVTIYAMSLPPDTTSNKAWASFTPTSGLIAINQRTAHWDSQFQRAVRASYTELQLLAGRDYGISWIHSYNLMASKPVARTPGSPDRASLVPSDVRTGAVLLHPGEHPFPSAYVNRRPHLRIEPSIYLDAMTRDVLLFGGDIDVRRFDTVSDFMSLDESLIVNCTGLGSRDLFGDEELTPVKGQLTFLVPQPEVDYVTFGGIPGRRINAGAFGIHMLPRRDGIALGGTTERGVWDMQPNEEARRGIVQAHIDVFNAMKTSQPGMRVMSSVPPIAPPSVESFFDLGS